MAMNGGSVESVELAIERWTRDDRGRPSIVSSRLPAAGRRGDRPTPCVMNPNSEFSYTPSLRFFDHQIRPLRGF